MFAALSQYEERFTNMEQKADHVNFIEKIDRVVGQLLVNIQLMNAAMQTLLKSQQSQHPNNPNSRDFSQK